MEKDQPEKKELHPWIKEQLLYLKKQEKIGSNFRNIKVSKSSLLKKPGDENCVHKFLFSIPYAGSTLHWDVKFYDDDVTYAPHFYSSYGGFFYRLTKDADESKLPPSWVNWNPTKPNALYDCIMEFVAEYRHEEVKKLYNYPEIFSEYISLLKLGYKKEDIEVRVDLWSITFLIPLDVDFSLLSTDIKNPNLNPKPVLLVSFMGAYPNIVKSKFFSVPTIYREFNDPWNLEMPKFHTPMNDYILEVKNFLFNKLKKEDRKRYMKREYMLYLLETYQSHILEFKLVNCRKVSFFFNTDGFHWILIVNMTGDFPIKKPTWILRSVYAFFYGIPIHMVVDYPYDEHWDPESMIKIAMRYTEVYAIPKFKEKNKVGFYTG